MTAARCVFGKTASELSVNAGSIFRIFGGLKCTVSRIDIHPNYDPTVSKDFDLAVLTVENPFTYSTNIQPISLSSMRPGDGTNAVVSG